MPVISTTWDSEVRQSQFKASLSKKVGVKEQAKDGGTLL
jgi:hypothetical protein